MSKNNTPSPSQAVLIKNIEGLHHLETKQAASDMSKAVDSEIRDLKQAIEDKGMDKWQGGVILICGILLAAPKTVLNFFNCKPDTIFEVVVYVNYLVAVILIPWGLRVITQNAKDNQEDKKTSDSLTRPNAILADMPILKVEQERLLKLLLRIQMETGARKLIVIRNSGDIMIDSGGEMNKVRNLSESLWNGPADSARVAEIAILFEDFPSIYLERLPESRWNNPFVVKVTEAGIRYIKNDF